MGKGMMCEACGLKQPFYGFPAEQKKRWCGPCGKENGAVSLMLRKMCDDCGLKAPFFGLGRQRWCSGCSKRHPGAKNLEKRCEDCRAKAPNYGIPPNIKKKRWCSGCAKAHGGVLSCSTKLCEDCNVKWPSRGLPNTTTYRWCVACANAHPGAVDLKNKNRKCVDCGLKQAHSLPTDRKRMWCATCRAAHDGAVAFKAGHKRTAEGGGAAEKKKRPREAKVKTRPVKPPQTCEGCSLKAPSFGLPTERKKRWCIGCAKQQSGAVSLVVRKMCEDCGIKALRRPQEGLKKLCCASCAKRRTVVSAERSPKQLSHKVCEDCGLKQPAFGLLSEQQKRWCGTCQTAHDGAVDLKAAGTVDFKAEHKRTAEGGGAARGKKKTPRETNEMAAATRPAGAKRSRAAPNTLLTNKNIRHAVASDGEQSEESNPKGGQQCIVGKLTQHL